MAYFLSVDLGLQGGLAILEDQKVLEVKPMPVIERLVGGKVRNQYDINAILEIVRSFQCCALPHDIKMAGMELLKPMQSSVASFSMGAAMGIFRTLFTVLGIPFTEMVPQKWQKEVFGGFGIQYNKTTTKQASIQAAKQIAPGINFLPTERSRKDSDGMTDAACIGYYISKL